jgi:hypothetical protein
MVGHGSAGEPGRADEIPADLARRELRGLERCRRALERGRRVRGRPIASGDQHGLLLDLHGALGHVPPAEAAARPPASRAWRLRDEWVGWVAAVSGDLVHLVARRGAGGDDGPVRAAEVVEAEPDCAVVRLDDGSRAVVPWEETSWEPLLERPALRRGDPIAGRVVGLTLDGPVLSPRAMTPSPWHAIALALPAGAPVAARVEALAGRHALLRTCRAPRAATVMRADALPAGTQPGDVIAATVARVNAHAGTLTLEALSPTARAPRPAPAAPTPGPRGPEQAASGSRS